MDASEVITSAAWTVDECSPAAFVPNGLPPDSSRTIVRDVSDIVRALDGPFSVASGLVASAIQRHTGAGAAGATLFRSGRYDAAFDCPDIAGFPSISVPIQWALERGQPLIAQAQLATGQTGRLVIVPIRAGDSSIGAVWAAGPAVAAPLSGRDAEILTCLADVIALASKSAEPSAPGYDEYQKAAGFRALIQSIQDYAIFTVDPQGIVTDWTEGAHRVLGFTAEEAIGRDFRMFFSDEDVRAGEPQKELDQAAAEGRAERESWRVHRNGSRIWVNAISSAVRNEAGTLMGFIKVSRDLTERRRIETEREDLKARLAAELEDMTHLHEMSMCLFEGGDFSRILEQILDATIGLQNADLGTIQLYDLRTDQLSIVAHQGFAPDFIWQYRTVPRDNKSVSGRAFRSCQRVIVEDIEYEPADEVLRTAARAAHFRALQCTPILSREGAVKGMLATHFRRPHRPSERDLRLTDLYMRLASELIARADNETELRNARRLADLANQAKSRFLATASHDLRQPLQSLSLLSGTLRRMATNPYLLEAVEQQGLAIASMSGLLNALLDISKLDSGSIQPSKQDVDLGEIADQMRIEFSGLAAKKGLELIIPPCAQFVYTDPTLLGQILRNLLSNAIRYTQSGSVALSSTACDDHVEIEVRDTGIGIPEAHLERIFEEFYQVDVRPNSTREGHGLGLSIVQRTAAILAHHLTVASTYGSGSSFKITVPVGQPSVKLAAKDELAVTDVSGKAPHILLIDDDPGVLKATRLLLEVEGYRVTVGRTLADTRAAVAKHADIQLLISDYHLSEGESGGAVIDLVRETLPRVEVILMTGDTSQGLRQVSSSDRICVASKPIEADALLGMMKRLLTHGHS